MKYNLIEKRDKIIKEVWENNKADLSMDEMAQVFSIPLPSFYRIVKKVGGRKTAETKKKN